MKKVLICMLAAAAMLPGATVFADGYNKTDNKVTVNDSTKKTVIIARNTGAKIKSEDIVYIDQSDSGFVSASFMLKTDPQVGFYTIMLGGDGSAATPNTFFIGSAEKLEDNFDDKIELKALQEIVATDTENNTVTKAYVSADAVELANAKSIVVKYGNKTACQELATVTSGGGAVKLAVKLEGIPEADKDNVQVWISSTEISTENLITK